MTTPPGYTTVAPWIVTDDTSALLAFIAKSFGGVELGKVPLEDGSIGHAEIRIGDTVVLAFDRRDGWPQIPSLLRVFVPDVDAATATAVDARASLVTPPLTQAFGQRGSRVRDPFGNIWWITTTVEDVAPDEMFRRLSEPEYAEAMQQAQRNPRSRAEQSVSKALKSPLSPLRVRVKRAAASSTYLRRVYS
jgi:PhnB protein